MKTTVSEAMINCKCKGEKNAQKIIKTLLVFEALWQLSFEAIIFGLLLDLAAVQQRGKKKKNPLSRLQLHQIHSCMSFNAPGGNLACCPHSL